MKMDRKIMVIVGVVAAVLLLAGVFAMSRRSSETKQSKDESLPTEAIIPTIDNSVQVDLVASSAGREVTLQIKSIPTGTKTIDYELSYQTKQQGLQGVIGTIQLKSEETDIDKKLTLGTCSSGTCIYHQVVGKIRLNLRFTGDYGDKVFEKEYKI